MGIDIYSLIEGEVKLHCFLLTNGLLKSSGIFLLIIFSEVKKRLLKEFCRNLYNFFKNRLAFSYQRHLNSTLAGNFTSHPIHTTERFNTLQVQYSIMTDKMQIIYRVLTSMPDSKRFLTKTKEMIYLN